MSRILFVLGKDPELSLAELKSVYPKGTLSARGTEFAVLELNHTPDQREFDRMGGAIKAAQLLKSVRPGELVQALSDILSERHQGNKLLYGLSLYDWPQGNLRRTLLDLKKSLKSSGLSGRFLNQDFKNLTSAHSKGLKHSGVELLAAKAGGELLVGEVIASQDIDAYSKRDYEKPYRNMKVGMLPPKLAQILINLTGLKAGTLWDPFCGGGVLLMEGVLMGYKMLGSDIESAVLAGAQKNLDWLRQLFSPSGKAELFSHDARHSLKSKSFDAIATEGYLGPPQFRPDQIPSIVSELESLYVNFFKALASISFRGPVVIAMPFFRMRDREVFLDRAIQKIDALGFKTIEPCFTYARPDQLVGRAIYRFD